MLLLLLLWYFCSLWRCVWSQECVLLIFQYMPRIQTQTSDIELSSWSPAWALLYFFIYSVKRKVACFDDPTPAELSADSDDNLFECILSNSHHVLNHLLPDKTNHEHNLRERRHNRSLCVKADEKKLSNQTAFLSIHIRLVDYYYCTIHVYSVAVCQLWFTVLMNEWINEWMNEWELYTRFSTTVRTQVHYIVMYNKNPSCCWERADRTFLFTVSNGRLPLKR